PARRVEERFPRSGSPSRRAPRARLDMRKVLLGIVALLIAGELLAAAATSTRRAARKVRVGDPALARELVTGGATLIADYGAFQLLEVDPTRAAALIEAGRAEARDE